MDRVKRQTPAEVSVGGEMVRPAGWRQRVMAPGPGRTVAGVYAFLVVLILGSRAVSPSFGSISFTKTVIALSGFTAVVAFGQYLVVLTGGMDVSIPGVMALAGVLVTGLSLGEASRLWWVLPIVLVVGALIGVVNGVGIVYLKLAPIVTTLAVGVVTSGVVLVYTSGNLIGANPIQLINAVAGASFGNTVPNLVLYVAFFLVAGTILVNLTVFGRRVIAIGSNPQVAYLSGVRVGATLITVYALSGLSAAIGGVMLGAYGNNPYLGMGDPYLLLSIAAVVVGGCNILGGRGLYVGVVGGAIILTTISTTLAGTALPQAVRQIIFAVVIVGAVSIARQEN